MQTRRRERERRGRVPIGVYPEGREGFAAFLKAQRVRVARKWGHAVGRVMQAQREARADGWMNRAPMSVAQGRGSKKPGLDYYDGRRW